MAIFFSANKNLLSPKKCWDDWVRLGSLSKVRKEYWDDEIVNPNTGHAPTASAIQKSAYSWAISSHESLAEAHRRYEHECRTFGIVPTEDSWKKKVYKMGWLIYYQRPKKWTTFVSQHGLQAYAT